MLKGKSGKEYKLPHPNPLMEGQEVPEEEPAESYNFDNLGNEDPEELEPLSEGHSGDTNLDRIGEPLEVIRKQDGTPYILNGDMKIWDTENPDQDLMHSIDQENVELSGSPIYYYKVTIDEGNYDSLYMESRNKVRRQTGIELMANWEPVTPVNEMGSFGIDSPDEIVFNFNVREFREKVGEDLPTVGALIYTPFDKNWWEVIQYNHGAAGEDFHLWGKYRFAILARKYQESQTDQEPTRPEPNQAGRDITIR